MFFFACSDITFQSVCICNWTLFFGPIAVKVSCQFCSLSMQLAIALRPKLSGWLQGCKSCSDLMACPVACKCKTLFQHFLCATCDITRDYHFAFDVSVVGVLLASDTCVCKLTEGDTLGVRFFTAFCNHWHCTSLQPLHLRWFSHCFATIGNFYLVFLQWLNKTEIKKKNTKPKKHDKTQLSATTPPLGCAIIFLCFLFFLVSFFLGGVSWFIVFWFAVGSCAMVKQNQNPKTQKKQKPRNQKNKKTRNKMTRPNSLPLLPPWGVQSCFFLCFLVSCFLVRCWFLCNG